MIIDPIITALNTSTYVEISVADNVWKRDVSLHTEDDSSFTIATDSSGTNAAVIPAGKSLSFKNVPAGTTLLYAKAALGTPNLVLLTGLILT